MNNHSVQQRLRPMAILTLVVALLSSLVTLIALPEIAAAASPGQLVVTKSIVGNPTTLPTTALIDYRLSYACIATAAPPPVTCDGATLTDVLPTYTDVDGNVVPMNFSSSSGSIHTTDNGTFDPATHTVTFSFGPSFTAGSSGTLDIRGGVNDGYTPDNTVLANQAQFTLGAQTVTSTPATVTLRAQTALTVTKTVPTTSPLDNVTSYNVRVCGNGTPATGFGHLVADNTIVTDTLPAGAVFVSSDFASPVVVGNVVTWNFGRLLLTPCRQGAVRVRYNSPTFAAGQVVANRVDVTATQPGGAAAIPVQATATTTLTVTDSATLTKSSTRQNVPLGQTATWVLGYGNTGSTTLNNFVVTDPVPPEAWVESIITGRTNTGQPATVEYSVDNGVTWIALPGSPYSSAVGASQNVSVAALLAPGQAVTTVRWSYGSVPPNFTAQGLPGVDQPGVTTRFLSPSRTGVTYTEGAPRNCATLTFSSAAVPAGTTQSTCFTVFVGSRPAPGIEGASTSVLPATPITRGQTVSYAFTTRNQVNANGPIALPILTALLPADFTFVPGSTVWAPRSSGIAAAPDVVTVIPNFSGGRTLVRWSWSTAVNLPPGAQFNIGYQIVVASNAALTQQVTNFAVSNSPSASQPSGCEPSFGVYGIDTDDRDGDGSVTDGRCTNTASNPVVASSGINSSKAVQGELDAGFTSNGSTTPGGRANYRLTVANNGATPFLAGATFIDILPFDGDTLVASTATRGSQWAPYLIDQIQGNAATVEYSTSANPCRGEVGGPTTACDLPNWQTWNATLAGNPTVIKSLRFTFPTPLAPGDSHVFSWEMRTPLDLSLIGDTAYNSFAYAVQPSTGGPALTSEPTAVPLTVTAPPATNRIGDYVWHDLDVDGVQDATEPPIFGALVELWGVGNDGVRNTADDVKVGFTRTDSNGFYLFGGVPPNSTYFLKFFTPPGFFPSPQNVGGNDTIDSDAEASIVSPTGGWTSAFPFCTPSSACTNLDLDAGFYSLTARIGLVKKTNTADANTAPGPNILVGDAVDWTYEVSNLGSAPLTNVIVTDDKLGTIACPKSTLAVTEVMICSASGTAVAGQYSNLGTVTGQPAAGAAVSDTDQSHYFGASPGVSIQKRTNGIDANAAPGPFIPVGSPLTWTYLVRNTGNTSLINVIVSDDKLGIIACPQSTLAVAASMTCSAVGSAVLGQYANIGTVVARPPVGPDLTATDPSHYVGSTPGLSIVKTVNGDDANTAPGVAVTPGSTVTWRYVIQNTGIFTLTGVVLTDDQIGVITTCPKSTLLANETMTCTKTGTAAVGQYTNVGTVVGVPPSGPNVSASDPANYFGVSAGISIVKFTNSSDADVAPGPFIAVGDPVTWDYVVKNTGNVDLTAIGVSDSKLGNIICPKNVLVPAEQMTCTRTGLAVAGQYTNIGTATGTPAFGSPVTATNPSNYFGAVPGLSIVKKVNTQDADTAPGPYVAPGSTVTFTYDIRNTGNSTLTGIVLNDDKLSVIGCPKTSLAAGETMQCVKTALATVGQYTNVGTVTGTPPTGPAITASDSANYFGASPGVSIVKTTNFSDADTAPGPLIAIGDPVTWRYTVTNTGNTDLAGIVVSDDKIGAVSCTAVTLAVGASTTCEASGTAVAGQYSNIGKVTAVPPFGPTLTATNPSHYFGSAPGLRIVKSVNTDNANAAPGPYVTPGSTVTFTYDITNTGNSTLTGVALNDDKLGLIGCPKTSLGAGESMTCTKTDTAVTGQYTNVATVTGLPPVGTRVSASDAANYFGITKGIVLTKLTNGADANAAPGPFVPIGDVITWRYEIRNTGNTSLSAVTLTDDKLGVIGCPATTIAAGATLVCERFGTSVAGQYSNTGTASGLPPSGPAITDTDLSHYFGSQPGLALSKLTNGIHGPILVRLPSTVTWTYNVTNTGNTLVDNLVLTDDKEGVVGCPKTQLAAGESMTCTTSKAAIAGQYTNHATVGGTSPTGASLSASDTGSYDGAVPSVTLVKQTRGSDANVAPGPYIPIGETFAWTYIVTNTGNTALSAITVTDDLEGLIGCPKTSLIQGESMTCIKNGTAKAGQYTNIGTVKATPPVGAQLVVSDPSNYFGTDPGLEIQKYVNGVDADAAPGPYYTVGTALTWRYDITNSGNSTVSNIVLTDDLEGVIGCPKTSLLAGEVMSCMRTGLATAGQYTNIGLVTGDPPAGPALSASDAANYYGALPSLSLVKTTNGSDGLVIPVGVPLTWEFVVSNTGNTTLDNIILQDSKEGLITCPQTSLAKNTSMTCRRNGLSKAGQYDNLGTVTGVPPVGGTLTATDTSSYFGSLPGLTIVKTVNTDNANTAPGLVVAAGTPLTWRYLVTNTGNDTVSTIKVVDDKITGPIPCPSTTLAPNAVMTCTATGNAIPGQYTNIGTVTGTSSAGVALGASDQAYSFGVVSDIKIVKTTNGDDANSAPGPYIPVGDPVTWRYVVQNLGNAGLTGITVTDDKLGVVPCGTTTLAAGASMTCQLDGTAVRGQYHNNAMVLATDAVGGRVSNEDPSNYFGSVPGIQLVKTVNGDDANTAPGIYIPVDAVVTWDYVITNTGNADLTGVSLVDDVEGVVGCPSTTIAAGDSMTCTVTGTAVAGQYDNLGTVTGTPPAGPKVSASDGAHYFGSQPSMSIVKSTNGVDADVTPGPYVPIGSTVTWTYLVTNTGNVDLTGVIVSDDVENKQVPCPQTVLAPGASMTCTLTGTAIAGQYENYGIASGVGPNGIGATDRNLSHYFGSTPGLSLVKSVNGANSTTAPGPYILIGAPVTWTYLVTNTGDAKLTDVAVNDDVEGAIACPKNVLDPNETMTCEKSSTAKSGPYTNVGTVVGTPPSGIEIGASAVSHYFGSGPGITVVKLVNDNDANDLPGISVFIDDPVVWTYIVTNSGNAPLVKVSVMDDREGAIACPSDTLAVGASMTCTTSSRAIAGQYTNVATASGTPDGGGPAVQATDAASYFGTLQPVSLPVPQPDPDKPLPFTGTDVGSAVFWALSALAIGSALVVLGRRRRAGRPTAR